MTEQTLIVVSNTSPLTNLAAIGRFDLLRKVLGHLHVSRAVAAELTAGGRNWPGALEVSRSPWIEVHTVQNRYTVDALRLELDAGEAETIALALEMQADLVLMDEQDGRRAAEYLGLSVMGVVGLLVRATQHKHVVEVRTLLDMLRQQAGFYLSDAVYLHALELAGEYPVQED